jgi:hypothetical protein
MGSDDRNRKEQGRRNGEYVLFWFSPSRTFSGGGRSEQPVL